MSSIGSFRIRLKRRWIHKSSLPPDSAGSGTTHGQDSPSESEKCSTPYRLPRMSPRATLASGEETSPLPPLTSPESETEKVWGRFGYEKIIRMPELGPSIHKAHINTQAAFLSASNTTAGALLVTKGQRYHMGTMMAPKVRSAPITPIISVRVVRKVDEAGVHFYKSLLDKAAHMDHHTPVNPAPSPTPTVVSRSVSPAKSTQSIHWTLGSSRPHLLFDRTGQGRKQGPYSREFTVRCMAPSNWMRMKWGRQGTVVH